MSKKDKLLERLLTRPTDFTFSELTALLGHLGYVIDNKGKTSGSKVRFKAPDGIAIQVHKPHPGNILKPYQINQVIDTLTERGEI